MKSRAKNPLIVGAISLGVGILIVLIDGSQGYIRESMHDHAMPPFWRLLLWPGIYWMSWSVLATGVYFLSRRFVITRDNWGRPLMVHVAGCLITCVLHVSMQVVSMALPAYAAQHESWAAAILHHATTSAGLNILIYWAIVGVSHTFIFYTRYRLREVESAQLEAELHRAQLSALKMQLQPHFLFNTLNAISTLMYRDVRAADRMVARLGELMRQTIEMGGINEVALSEEIGFLRKYLEIEQARFEDRLSVEIEVESGIEGVHIPNLLLQPLVENAIKHGIAHVSGEGRIEIRARKKDDALHISVSDNGPGLAAGDGSFRYGTGLRNTIGRLDRLYPDRYAIDFAPNTPSGLVVTLQLPIAIGRAGAAVPSVREN